MAVERAGAGVGGDGEDFGDEGFLGLSRVRFCPWCVSTRWLFVLGAPDYPRGTNANVLSYERGRGGEGC